MSITKETTQHEQNEVKERIRGLVNIEPGEKACFSWFNRAGEPISPDLIFCKDETACATESDTCTSDDVYR